MARIDIFGPSGSYRRTTECIDGQEENQVAEGEVYFLNTGVEHPETQYVVDGAVLTRPARPTHFHEWSGTNWVDARPLLVLKEERLAQIKSARDAHLFGGFVWDGSPFDSDQIAQSRLMGLYVSSMSPAYVSVTWRLADNSWRTLNASDASAVWSALESHLRSSFVTFATLEAQINGATTKEELETIQWPTS